MTESIRRIAKFVPILVLLCVLLACDKNRVYDSYQSVAKSWEKDEKITFKLPILDKALSYNLFINVRNDSNYPFDNIFMIAEMNFPNGKIVKDTLEYKMAAKDGSWLGTGITDLKESKLWYKENVRFTEDGSYHVTLQHAMRKNGKISGVVALKGVLDVGFRIEYAK